MNPLTEWMKKKEKKSVHHTQKSNTKPQRQGPSKATRRCAMSAHLQGSHRSWHWRVVICCIIPLKNNGFTPEAKHDMTLTAKFTRSNAVRKVT